MGAWRVTEPMAKLSCEMNIVAKAAGVGDLAQIDLDAWVRSYNEERPHQGRWCFGKTPMQTFVDGMPLAKEKMIAASSCPTGSTRSLSDAQCQIKYRLLQLPRPVKTPSILLNSPTHPIPTTFRCQIARSYSQLRAASEVGRSARFLRRQPSTLFVVSASIMIRLLRWSASGHGKWSSLVFGSSLESAIGPPDRSRMWLGVSA
jgi:hypothetical protein